MIISGKECKDVRNIRPDRAKYIKRFSFYQMVAKGWKSLPDMGEGVV